MSSDIKELPDNILSFDVKNVIVNDSLWQSVNGGDKATKNSDERRDPVKE